MVAIDISLPLAGVFFLLCGIWWSIQTTKKYYQAKQERIAFTSSTAYASCLSCRKLPVESLVKFIYSIGYVVYEIILATDFGKATDLHYINLLHMTIFAFFAISFIMEILQHFKVKLIVDDLDYITLIFAFGAQALLNGCHSSTQYSVDCVVHNLTKYTAVMCCVVTALEMKFRHNVIFPLFRGVFVMVLGTWILHTAVIFVDKDLFTDTKKNAWMISLYFTWHCGINAVIMLCIWLITYKLFMHNKCCCLPIDSSADNEGVCLYNRVRFDYPLLDRFESDVD